MELTEVELYLTMIRLLIRNQDGGEKLQGMVKKVLQAKKCADFDPSWNIGQKELYLIETLDRLDC